MKDYQVEEFADGKGRVRNGSPTFYKLLDEAAELHDKKSHDYASSGNPAGNYHFAGELALLFGHSPKDAGFVGRIGEKMYRLANLERDGKTPLNETVDDTEKDITVITLLWISDRRERRLHANQEAYRVFNNDSREVRDHFVREMAQYLTPIDLEYIWGYLGDVLRAKQGQWPVNQEAKENRMALDETDPKKESGTPLYRNVPIQGSHNFRR